MPIVNRGFVAFFTMLFLRKKSRDVGNKESNFGAISPSILFFIYCHRFNTQQAASLVVLSRGREFVTESFCVFFSVCVWLLFAQKYCPYLLSLMFFCSKLLFP
jgi:hypothetical protein